MMMMLLYFVESLISTVDFKISNDGIDEIDYIKIIL